MLPASVRSVAAPSSMPVLNNIFNSSLRLARRTVPSMYDLTNVPGLGDKTTLTSTDNNVALGHANFLTNADTTNTNSTIETNSTLALDYSTGLTGVNLELDQQFVRLICVSMVTVVAIVLILRLWQLCSAHLRHLACLHAGRREQNYWTFDKTSWWPWLKREVIYSPLGRKRHNREIQLSSAINYGTLPGRVHAVLLICYALSNLAYCLILPYGGDRGKLVAELRGRTGMLATVNMMPLIIMAARNNPAIAVLKISFNSFNLFHRWLGRLIIVEAIVHVSAWYVNYSTIHGPRPFLDIFSTNLFLTAGLSAVVCMITILFQSLSAVRHAFYEVFVHLHVFLAFVSVLGVYIHLEVADLPALPFIRAVVVLWLLERSLRLLRIVYLNCSWRGGMTYITVEALPADACRVTFQLPRHVTVKPGSHIYAYIPRISWWQSHPFSVAWTNIESEPPTGFTSEHDSSAPASSASASASLAGDEDADLEKQGTVAIKTKARPPTTVSLVMAARTGMTRKLYEKAQKGTLYLGGYVEGPYAGHEDLSSYGTVVMFAGGAGITHHLVQIRHLVACARANTVATRKIVLVWTVRDLDALSWIRPWMDEILRMPGRKEMLNLEIYVTRGREASDYASPSTTIKLYPKRCDPGEVLDRVIPERVGAMMVTICGPGAFADEVRAAVRSRLHLGTIDMNEEAFTW